MRATFTQTPESLDFRAKTTTSCGSLFVAGDWSDTGLPATIEGAVRSGFKAAKAVVWALAADPVPPEGAASGNKESAAEA